MSDYDNTTNVQLHCGCDESGRGCLAGPVVAAAVILDPTHPIAGLADSKVLSSQRRDQLDVLIREHALCWSIAQASVEEINTLNILQASLLAMRRAVEGLTVTPHKAIIDGNKKPPLSMPVETVVGGDATIPAISAASILAKVERDRIMLAYHSIYPQYHFDRHKSYATALHLAMLDAYGPLPIHRSSFAPVSVRLARSPDRVVTDAQWIEVQRAVDMECEDV